MGTYVTAQGFVRKTLQEVRQQIEAHLIQAFGPSFETSVDSPNGQLISQLALAISSQWDLAQEVYVSRDPSQATGQALDWAAALTGVTRKEATACRVLATAYTDGNTATIPAGSSAVRSRGNLEFRLDDDLYIDQASCDDLLIVDTGSSPNTDYVFHFTFGDVTAHGTTAISVRSDLYFKVLALGASAEFTPEGIRVYMANGSKVGLTGSLPDDFDILAGSRGYFTAVSTGPQTCEVGELNSIPNSVTGWVSVYNYTAGVPGTSYEDDTALRMRREVASHSIKSKGTDDAVAAHLVEDVPGVTSAVVRSNRSMTVDEYGRPPKSFEVLVQGGDDLEVAQCILANQASGIESYGNVSVVVTDGAGDEQVIKFSRPVAIYLWVKITYHLYSEEQAPTEAEIRAAVMSWAASEYGLGTDIIPDRIKGGLYLGTTGLGQSTIQVAVTSTPEGTPSYSTATIPVAAAEYAVLSADRITLVQEA